MCGIYTSCMKPLFSFPVSDLPARCFLAADAHLCHGVLRGTNCPETWVDLGFWLPSLHSGAPRELRDGVFQHQTGRDSLGKKCEVFSPFREGSSLQKVAEASLSGPVREGRQWHPTASTPHLRCLRHSPGSALPGMPFSVSYKVASQETDKRPHQTRDHTSAQLCASATFTSPTESKWGGKQLGKGGLWGLKAQDKGNQQ